MSGRVPAVQLHGSAAGAQGQLPREDQAEVQLQDYSQGTAMFNM